MMLREYLFSLIVTELKLWADNFNSNYGITPKVQRAFNTGEQQSVQPDLTCFLFDIDTTRLGSQGTDYTDDGIGGVDATSTQLMEHKFQIKLLEKSEPLFGPKDLTKPSSYDAALDLTMWLQSTSAISRLQADDIGIYRITGIKNHKPKNDSDMYELEPTFDFVLSYTQKTVSKASKIDLISGDTIAANP